MAVESEKFGLAQLRQELFSLRLHVTVLLHLPIIIYFYQLKLPKVLVNGLKNKVQGMHVNFLEVL